MYTTRLQPSSTIRKPNSDVSQKTIPNKIRSIKSAHSADGSNIPCDRGNEEEAIKSSDCIKRFLRKVVAAQSYSKMLSEGEVFKRLNTDLPPLQPGDKASLATLEHFDNISRDNLASIKGETQNLTTKEQKLLKKVVNTPVHFRHQSNSNFSTQTIMSLDMLKSTGIATGKNTDSMDEKKLGNQDFVFFGVEFSDDESQLPLNTLHTTLDFGANAYITKQPFPHGYLTLTDHFDNIVPPALLHEHQVFIQQFGVVRNEVWRTIHGTKGQNDVPMYNTRDMKLALGLHLINFLRKSKDDKFKRFVLNENLDSRGLDRVINFVFQPEFHVPRMVNIEKFRKVKLRKMELEEAIRASNVKEMAIYIKNKDDACKAMSIAIVNSKLEIVEYLFSEFNFTKADVSKMTISCEDIEYSLSKYSANPEILKIFLERGLVDPNHTFKQINYGMTMLDNAIKYSDKDMIKILKEHGAQPGKLKHRFDNYS
ncbi:T3SS effector OspC family protein [Vibrio aestuarianus]|uniref:T3SS effector OspC family protein n=1 Tax=Vibrio aestuarianus TaxID=28171 RepID=A0A9X4ES53_9VIBR|nr:T3SS effector OspC family protein [Vibrio aestuarianus]MDE1241254.1 T3SS effector OspC family protein [Vibrio aestuarianus]